MNVNSIDLSCITQRMMAIHNWPKRIACRVSNQYRNYLALKVKYGTSIDIPPSREIDEFWHNHILHTKKYHEDCINLFGKYLHHDPHLENLNNDKLFEENTQRLYHDEFGDYLYITYPKLYNGDFMKFLKRLFGKKKAKAAICL